MKSAEKSYIPDSVDRGNPRPLNEQVYDEICRAIVEKRLVPGDILPQRERLAEAFGVGVNTVLQSVSGKWRCLWHFQKQFCAPFAGGLAKSGFELLYEVG